MNSKGRLFGAMLIPIFVIILGIGQAHRINVPSHNVDAGTVESARASRAKKVFSIPIENLKDWSTKVIVSVKEVTISGHSNVHNLDNDCEMHFGGSIRDYSGDPSGIVIEPMNLCVMPFFGKKQYAKADWTNFANSIVGSKVSLEGVPRIWPEHLEGDESPSNPNHALEIHPLTKLKAKGKTYDFSKFVFDPETYEGGVSQQSAINILEKIVVGATKKDDLAEIDFSAGKIGNFTSLDLEFFKDSISAVGGGYSIEGEVIVGEEKMIPVHLVIVAGSPMNSQVKKWKLGKKASIEFEALVLFSLSPKALYEAVSKSNGDRVAVEKPIQLIVYGTPQE